MDDISRSERLLVERLKLGEEQATHTGKLPDDKYSCSTNPPSSSEMRRPVILEADRLSFSPEPRDSLDPWYPPLDGSSPFHEFPNDGFLKILEYLTLVERTKLSRTCRRFYGIITDKKVAAMRDITVINLFQRRVWERSVRNNTTNRMTMFDLDSSADIRSFLKHVKKVDCLKIWYHDSAFVDTALDAIDESVIIRSIDIYPYNDQVATDKVAEVFPKILTLTMRPHGQTFFWKGLGIHSLPNFSNLTTLMLDSFEVLPPFAFPPSIKTLDFAHRKLEDMHFFDALDGLDLEMLSLSHIRLGRRGNFAPMEKLVSAISKMKRLEGLMFKFCHLDVPMWVLNFNKLRLRHIHFDLCYDVDYSVMETFVRLSQKTMKSVSVNVLFDDDSQFHNTLNITPLLKQLGVTLSFSLMQKDIPQHNNKNVEFVPDQNNPNPMPAIPSELREVLSRFEASYLIKDDFLRILFSKVCNNLQECKFVATKALNDDIMEFISVNCPNLRKLTVISCEETTEEGLLAFAQNILLRRTSAPLKIMYKNNGSIVRVYGELYLRDDIKDFVVQYQTKTFPGNLSFTTGETLFYKHRDDDRTIIIKNHTPNDSSLLFGLVIDLETEMLEGDPEADKITKVVEENSEQMSLFDLTKNLVLDDLDERPGEGDHA
ncbi:hypothetical protein PFISCL1PPCAC_25021 [Pristionchus fissidentatus]|uniref:F-box domain-containing protein n=1 Tax=Pristionchus fissidentatus TaxID=1538716 RepID=A0AAV5WNL6_9BILA|nr:hypothetical protein PFISCL1PPCAC_25021 [Pristionchus fissidentatus]